MSAKFTPASVTSTSSSPGPQLRLDELDEPQHLRPSEFLLLDRAHVERERYPRRRMSLTVVGSIAYDAVITPFG